MINGQFDVELENKFAIHIGGSYISKKLLLMKNDHTMILEFGDKCFLCMTFY